MWELREQISCLYNHRWNKARQIHWIFIKNLRRFPTLAHLGCFVAISKLFELPLSRFRQKKITFLGSYFWCTKLGVRRNQFLYHRHLKARSSRRLLCVVFSCVRRGRGRGLGLGLDRTRILTTGPGPSCEWLMYLGLSAHCSVRREVSWLRALHCIFLSLIISLRHFISLLDKRPFCLR